MEYSSEDDLHLHANDNNVDAFKEMNGDDDSEVVSSDPFGLNKLIQNHGKGDTHAEKDSSIPFPPGYTPDIVHSQSPVLEEHEKDTSRIMEDAQHVNVHASPGVESKTKTGGSVLEILDGIIKVGHAMGFNMEGCINDMKSIIGGILCVWDPCYFHKDHHILSDNFVALYGTWIPKREKVLLIFIYAPQSATGKRILWDYISSLVCRWNGLCMVMVDFNEVRCKEDRLGSIFNVKDHRPILLREVVTDYRPILFRFYHSWFSFESFDQMVRETWNNIVLDDRNVMIRLKKKLQILKKEIRIWIGDYKKKHDGRINDLKFRLRDIDTIVDSGEGLQKGKIKWAVEGDENSKFFHGMINRMHANLAVKGIMVDGEWVDDPTRVKDEFKSHFASRFQAPNSNRCCLNFTFHKCLDTIQSEELESPISIVEVRKAVWGCGDNKSPGPDGFTAEFFRKYWDILGSDLYDAVVWFFDNGSFARGCNTSFITLIPKIQDPKFVSDYRPISLIGCLYKVITKVIANRLSLIISDLISNVQSAFLPNRQILDGPFIINELLSWCKFKKQQAMVFKVDFEKAYDSVRWDFLQDILTAFGFGSKWCSWIRGCLQSATASVLLNGLNIGTSFTMSHLFYADDAVFIREWSNANISGITKILKCFSLLSGLKINLKKSHLLGVGLTNEVIEAAAENLGCATMKTPFKYLGVMFGDNCSKVQAWEDTISKIGSWVDTYLQLVYLQDAKRGFAHAGIYSYEFFLMESIAMRGKLHGALLFKWIWRFISGDNSLWCRFIKAMHGNNLFKSSNFRSSNWITIVREVFRLKDCGVDLLSYCHRRVGNGLCTKFWKDLWIGDTRLCELFPRIYALETNKDALVAEKMRSVSASFRRDDLNGEGAFRVRDVRVCIDEFFLLKADTATRWVKYVPIKVNIFVCVVWLRKLLGAFVGGGIYLGLPLDHMMSGYRGSRPSG
nr:RNA-directed DNA polymerase, eukaryota, reverse transcriptase zinc-binding domain protein [Tanacetum cinerariifolium]